MTSISSFGGSFSGGGGTTKPATINSMDCHVPQAGNDQTSSLSWSRANLLVASSWDSSVRCWQVMMMDQQQQQQSDGGASGSGPLVVQPKAQVNHANSMPVLDTCFSPDGGTVFSVGGDKAVRMWQLGQQQPPNNTPQQIGAHDAPIKTVGFLTASNLIVSGGWDAKLKCWDARSPSPVGILNMPERVYAMDVHQDGLLVVATAGRHILVYDCSASTGGQPREVQRMESPLKYQSRCIACFADAKGFAVGSIEGRVGIRYLLKAEDSFAFKCHRQESNAYSVNGLAFHPQLGTFATFGSDGVVSFWDKDNKQRLKEFPAIQRPVSAARFNPQGNLFAYASSYDWSQGSYPSMHVVPGNDIYVHRVVEDEIRAKSSGHKTTATVATSTSWSGYGR